MILIPQNDHYEAPRHPEEHDLSHAYRADGALS
jgi:hypothetical protein